MIRIFYPYTIESRLIDLQRHLADTNKRPLFSKIHKKHSTWKFSLDHEIGRSYYNYYQIEKYALFCDGISKNGINTNCHFYSDHNWLILDLISRKTFWYKIPKTDIGKGSS